MHHLDGRYTLPAWAHTPGSRIDAVNCVFWQDAFWRPARQMWRDWTRHLGQAWADEGWRGLFRPGAWLPGVCRGRSPFYTTPVDSILRFTSPPGGMVKGALFAR